VIEPGSYYWFCHRCGLRLGYEPFHDIQVKPPEWHKGKPYCRGCARGFKIVRGDFGMAWRPKEKGE